MSDRTERSAMSIESDSITDVIVGWYHVPVLAGLMAFMFWVRAQAYGTFMDAYREGGAAFAAVDSWYHWRTTMYTVQNWPFTMPYDVWTGYPTGRYVGQFGTLFDQIVATVAMIVGLGSPTEATVFQVAILMPAVFAALCAIPVYYIGRRLGGRIGGLSGVALLALFPETFLQRSTVGMLQHHVAEVLFMAIAILAMMVALTVAEREKPVYELVAAREVASLRRPFAYSVLAGVALALYVWVWPPGVVLIGVFGAFFAIKLAADYVRGESPDHVAFVGAVALGTTGVLTLATIEVTDISATSAGLLQPLLAFVVAVGCVFMAWLAREWDARDLNTWLYPVTVVGILVAGSIVLAVALPDLFGMIWDNVHRRLLFGQHATDLTIEEAQPPDDLSAHVFSEYGLAFYTAVIGAVALLARPFVGDRDHRAEYLLIVVWAAFITSMAFTQVRFNYYLAVVVAVLNAHVVGLVVRWADFDTADPRRIEGYQVMTVLAVFMVLLVPLTPIAGATVVDHGEATGPSSDSNTWASSNEWLAGNTPEQGTYGGANASLDYYGTYERPADGDFEYPDGTYGVMSWWDYGHLITVQGERIPHANPFQQNARSASAFLTAQSEERSETVLDAIATDQSVDDLSDGELAEERTARQDGEGIRYVMIDDSMAGGKFDPITAWSGPDYEEYLSQQEYAISDNETISALGVDENYENTTLANLYFDDARDRENYRLVHESEQQTEFVSVAVSEDGETWNPFVINQEMSPQLQTQLFRIAQNPNVEAEIYDQRQAAAVKTYERVEGAEIAGTADAEAGTTVTATVELTATPSNRSFAYAQRTSVDEDGEFTMTVPYATDDELGPDDGYTNASVLAVDDYTVAVGDEQATEVGTTEVPESAIYEGETIAVDLDGVENEEADVPDETGTETTDGGGETAGDDGTTDENGETDGATDEANVSSSRVN